MGAMNVQFLCVTDDRPIDGNFLAHDAEFDKRAELPNHQETLFDSSRMTGCFDIDVASVAARQFNDLFACVFLLRIDPEVSAGPFSDFESVVTEIKSDNPVGSVH